MVIRQSSQRVERRRRVLADDRRLALAASDDSSVDSGGSARAARRYAAAAQRDQQMRLCDLIPLRPFTLLVWFLASATFVAAHAALEAAYQWLLSRQLGIDLTPLRLAAPSQLANYTLSLSLLLAAFYALFVLNLRRHKVNDYRGHYRLWYYVSAMLLLASVVVGSGLSQTIRESCRWAMAQGGTVPSAWWLVALLAILGLAIGIRLIIEIRESRGAVICLVSACMLAVISGCFSSRILQPAGDEFRQLLATLSELASAQLLLLSFVVYLRHVFLDAQGAVSERSRSTKQRWSWRRKQPRRAPQSEPATGPVAGKPTDSAMADVDRKSTSSAKSEAMRDKASVVEDEDDLDDEQDDDRATIQMSRSDRRRLRKAKRSQQHAA